jgi:hypothetical protein
MQLNQCLLDVELVEGELTSFSAEYTSDKKSHKLILFLPFCIIQLTTRWSNH